MFAMKNMDKLLKLKLDMVYRNLSVEEAQKLYSESNAEPPKPLAKRVIRRVRVKENIEKKNNE
jgi:ribosomal protein L13E